MELPPTSRVLGPKDSTTRISSPTAGSDGPRMHAGDRLGRYELVRLIGEGGMGEVYEGRDPQLDRPVAIKVLHRGRHGGDERDAEVGEQRLRREAKALASLSHPNVVQIFDVGRREGRVWIAMELVDGETLASWITPQRSLDEVLEVFYAAADGLAAAHAAGIVHRDFKLTNVMLDTTGRARVLDFGLSTAFELDTHSITRMASGDPDPDMFTVGHGKRVGTPLYMSPEQRVGGEVDARTDQYGLCVSLHLALYGRYPEQVLDQSPRGRTVTLEHRPPVPAAIATVLEQGLANRPDDRFESMDALVAALRRARRPWHGRPALRVGVLLGVAGGLAWLAVPSDPEPCGGGESKIGQTWDQDRRDRLTEALGAERRRGSSQTIPSATASTAVARLHAWTDRWTLAHREACEAHDGPAGQLDHRMACLDAQLATFDGLTTALTEGDAAAMSVVTAVADLPRPQACLVVADGRRTPVPDDPLDRAEAESIRRELARQQGVIEGGAYRAALEVIEPLVERAERLGYDPVLAEALSVQSEAVHQLHEVADARALVERAYHLARGSGHEAHALSAATDLVYIVGVLERDPAGGADWNRQAEALLQRLGRPADLAAKLELNQGLLAYARGEHEAAIETFERAAASMRSAGEVGARLANVYNNIGVNQQMMGRLPQARDAYQSALSIYREAYGEGHPLIGQVLANLGAAQRRLGDEEAARRSLERSVEIGTETGGTDNPVLYAPLVNLGNLELLRGHVAEAIALFERAIVVLEAARGPEHPSLAEPLDALADALGTADRHAESARAFERALALLEPSPEVNPGLRAHSLLGHGVALLELGRRDEGRAQLRRALQVLEHSDSDPGQRGETRLRLALSLDDPAEARPMVRQALRELSRADDRVQLVERAERWLQEHQPEAASPVAPTGPG